MRKFVFLGLTAGLFCLTPAMAQAAVEHEYVTGATRATTPWYAPIDEAARQADLTFLHGMRPHHAGALTMSTAYLTDSGASSPVLRRLARGIIHNQAFEIDVLDSISGFMEPPVDGPGAPWRQVGAEGQAQVHKFFRAPMPSYYKRRGTDPTVSVRDVQFAKAMIIHHQGALDMARAYLRDPAARNAYLKQLCLDIILDQAQEIALMNRIAAAYPGDSDSVTITADMIHGMEGMSHGAHGGHESAVVQAPSPVKAPASAPPKAKAKKRPATPPASTPKAADPDHAHHHHH